ncbi:unnamed protein product [Chilo suppressalis]|uniref:Ubiquitin-like protein ATG12 n=1 Tax=Chilo suppressalis TaxID=168631 RepID=A0ABN8AQF1_CHISP|nr:unnamed protein product [Chilo suppressalis]
MIKAQLIEIVKLQKTNYNRYAVEELTAEYGVTILRLPPYHYELNPIELVWAQAKGFCNNVVVSNFNMLFKIMAEENQSGDSSLAHNSIKSENESKENGDAGKADKVKIDILLKATGNAPIMKKKKWAVDAEKQIGWIMEFVKKYLKLEPDEKLFLYVNQTFAPSPDQIVKNLYECFGTDGKLVLHYCKSQAWG